MIFQYNNIPQALLPIIKERVETCRDFFPAWCQKVVVEYDSKPSPDYELSCESEYNYRFVVLTVAEEFLREENWRDAVLHEIVHAVSAPFTTQSWMAIETLAVDDATRKYVETQLRMAEEAFATDLACLLDKVLNTKNNG